MPADEIYDSLSTLSNYTRAGGVFFGFFLADAVMPGVVHQISRVANATDQASKIPSEVYGLMTALLGFTLGAYTDYDGVGNSVALGGLVSVLDNVTERFNVKTRTKNALTQE